MKLTITIYTGRSAHSMKKKAMAIPSGKYFGVSPIIGIPIQAGNGLNEDIYVTSKTRVLNVAHLKKGDA